MEESGKPRLARPAAPTTKEPATAAAAGRCLVNPASLPPPPAAPPQSVAQAAARAGRVLNSSRGRSFGSAARTKAAAASDQLAVERAKRLRSASPAVSDVSNSESRGLFVRPQQVLYVVDAVV